MKTKITLTLVCLFGLAAFGNAQTNNTATTDSSKQMNLLDEQVKVLNSVFALGGEADNPLGGATNYLQLLNQSDMDPELKKELKEQYKIYDLSLDPNKKDSLAIAFNKKLQEAMEKSQNDMNNE